jgi:ribonuclease BN (tRNA processing enzyme)
MRLIPFGTNGFFESFGRATACFLIPYKKILVILDAGTGLFRLTEPVGKKLLSEIKEVHFYLSHYHLDHTFGFYAAFRLLEGKKVKVFSSQRRQVFRELVDLKYFPVDYTKEHKNFKWISLTEGKYKISDYKVMVMKQNHRKEISLAYRFYFPSGGLSYVTDGEPIRKVTDFVAGTPLLLHEHGAVGKIDGDKLIDGHATTVAAAIIAKEANVGRLLLIHHKPYASLHELEKQLEVARSIFPKTDLAQDLTEVEF